MAKFNGIKEGDLLFKSSDYDVSTAILLVIGSIGTIQFVTELLIGHEIDFWFITRGLLSIVVMIFFGWMVSFQLFGNYQKHEGFYLVNRIEFKFCYSKLLTFNKTYHNYPVNLNEIDCFLNGKGDIVEILFLDKKKVFIIDYLVLAKSYKKNKSEVIDFLNKKIKESRPDDFNQ